ncbi:MAG: hypothetical protein F4139_10335 [Gemmatimonadetes bacterium]|nr:hypothetical protein [Gemmatimonadota bacterium]MYA64948.1 hypothetical protein [Gemmatimonadota bacterium]MYB98126.1 hypothetical protein [Gemmatimonadota bacterium]MYH53333.1 hypothetical protein [Gemmatimonadota bacterium]MYI45947.1 hypothetical protein [Gemmatimonadota bacterium]
MAGTWFGALLGLYAIYALIAFYQLPPRYPGIARAIMILGPTMMALALLTSAAAFAASAMRFDMLMANDPQRRRVYWAQLGLIGIGALLLVAFGAPAVRTMIPRAVDLAGEPLPSAASALSQMRLLFPVPFGVFAVLAGVAGALVGRTTSRSVSRYAGAVPWLACFGLIIAFAASFLGTSSLILEHGFSSFWIIVAPVTVPLVMVAALARWEGSGIRSLVGLSGKTAKSEPMDPDTVDEVVCSVLEPRHWKGDPGTVTTVSAKDDMALLAHGIRRVAGSRAEMSPARVSDIVERLVTPTNNLRTKSIVDVNSGVRAAMAEFASAFVSLAAGCLVVGSLGGVIPSISSAMIAGFIGSGGLVLYLRGPHRRRSASHP